MNDPLSDYSKLVDEWIKIRQDNQGKFSDDELPLMDNMTYVWQELNQEERKKPRHY